MSDVERVARDLSSGQRAIVRYLRVHGKLRYPTDVRTLEALARKGIIKSYTEGEWHLTDYGRVVADLIS